ncbi:MAG: hypothetical protein Q4E16_00095 [Neisseria sp.]|nr:hypothetical protein [Neisseria sp.]
MPAKHAVFSHAQTAKCSPKCLPKTQMPSAPPNPSLMPHLPYTKSHASIQTQTACRTFLACSHMPSALSP